METGVPHATRCSCPSQIMTSPASYRSQTVPAGMRPYMEDRSAVVASFTPQSAAGGPMRDGVLRSFAAIYDGHNGAHSATYCSTRCKSATPGRMCCCFAAHAGCTCMRDSLPLQCCRPVGPSPCLPAHEQQTGPEQH